MSQGKNTSLPEELLDQVREAAQVERRSPDDLVMEAVERYLRTRRFERLVAYGEERAAKLGIKESDVPRLVREVRDERGR